MHPELQCMTDRPASWPVARKPCQRLGWNNRTWQGCGLAAWRHVLQPEPKCTADCPGSCIRNRVAWRTVLIPACL